MPLIFEKPLVFSPQLAATLGLEQAILLQALHDAQLHGQPEQRNGFVWLDIGVELLLRLLPFWRVADIQRITSDLRDQGVLLIGSPPLNIGDSLRFAFNDTTLPVATPVAATPAPRPRSANTIATSWQPEKDVLSQLALYNIPREFALQQVPEFVTYWNERQEPRYSWGSRFIKHVLRLWREQETQVARKEQETGIPQDWRPSADAMHILTRQADINSNFVEDAIPEFILYWRERGTASSTWNTQFIQHVKRQWARYSTTIEHDSEPRPIDPDWQPAHTVYEVLALANIERPFAENIVPEFILYWRDTGQASNAWNTKFLQYAKRQWAYHRDYGSTVSNHGTQQRSNPGRSTRHRDIAEELSDRSWAN